MTNKTIGKYGEELAKNFLINSGFKILEMNFRYSKLAEIDIIATKKNILHFIEVKTRTQNLFGAPLEAISNTKLKQIHMAANFYMQNTNKRFEGIQIDAIGILLSKEKEKTQIHFLENISL